MIGFLGSGESGGGSIFIFGVKELQLFKTNWKKTSYHCEVSWKLLWNSYCVTGKIQVVDIQSTISLNKKNINIFVGVQYYILNDWGFIFLFNL